MQPLTQKLNMVSVMLNVACFLVVVSKEVANTIRLELPNQLRGQALDTVLDHAPPEQVEALAIEKTRLRTLTDGAEVFSKARKNYDPGGSMPAADVFWVTSLRSVESDRRERMNQHFVQRKDFVFRPRRFHKGEGVHSKMLKVEIHRILSKSAEEGHGCNVNPTCYAKGPERCAFNSFSCLYTLPVSRLNNVVKSSCIFQTRILLICLPVK